MLKLPRETSFGHFPTDTPTTRICPWYLPSRSFLKYTLNTHFKHLVNAASLKYIFVSLCAVPLSHLRENTFIHNFQDTIKQTCSCSLEAESTYHFFLHCQNFRDLRKCLMKELIKIDSCILKLYEKSSRKLFRW